MVFHVSPLIVLILIQFSQITTVDHWLTGLLMLVYSSDVACCWRMPWENNIRSGHYRVKMLLVLPLLGSDNTSWWWHTHHRSNCCSWSFDRWPVKGWWPSSRQTDHLEHSNKGRPTMATSCNRAWPCQWVTATLLLLWQVVHACWLKIFLVGFQLVC